MNNFLSGFMIVMFIAYSIFRIAGGTDDEEAIRILKGAGYDNISTYRGSFFSCPEEYYRTGFSAKGPTDIFVKGTVCSGIFVKDSTIRLQ